MKRLVLQLDISSEEVETSLNQQRQFTTKEAIQNILQKWLKRQDNRYVVYITMGKALIHPDVGLNLVATEVLKYHPDERINELKSGVKRKRQRNRNRDQRTKLKKTLKQHQINGLPVNP